MGIFKIYKNTQKPNQRQVVKHNGKHYFKTIDEGSIDATNKITIEKKGKTKTIAINERANVKSIADLLRKPSSCLLNIEKFKTVLYSSKSIQYNNGNFEIVPINEILPQKPTIKLYWKDKKKIKKPIKRCIDFGNEGVMSINNDYKNHWLFGSYCLVHIHNSLPFSNHYTIVNCISKNLIRTKPSKKVVSCNHMIHGDMFSKSIPLVPQSLTDKNYWLHAYHGYREMIRQKNIYYTKTNSGDCIDNNDYAFFDNINIPYSSIELREIKEFYNKNFSK